MVAGFSYIICRELPDGDEKIPFLSEHRKLSHHVTKRLWDEIMSLNVFDL